MNSDSDHPLVAAILEDVKPTKSVICSVLAFLEAVEEDLGRPGGASSLRVVQEREVNQNGIVAQGRRAPQHVARFGLPTDNIKGDRSGRKTPQAQVIIPRLVSHLEGEGFESYGSPQKI